MSAQLSYKVGEKVIKASGRWIGAEVTVKAVFPDISEILIENYNGQVERVTIWDVHRPFAGFPPSFGGHRDAFEKELDSLACREKVTFWDIKVD